MTEFSLSGSSADARTSDLAERLTAKSLLAPLTTPPAQFFNNFFNGLDERPQIGYLRKIQVFEQAPASFTCKVDAAALYVTSDRDFHSANPLTRRHKCLPVVPFYNSAVAANKRVPFYDPSFLRYDLKIRNRDANKRGRKKILASSSVKLLWRDNRQAQAPPSSKCAGIITLLVVFSSSCQSPAACERDFTNPLSGAHCDALNLYEARPKTGKRILGIPSISLGHVTAVACEPWPPTEV
nr:zinc finger protein CONSTANS-LIKE 4-like [Ipomoea batatas]